MKKMQPRFKYQFALIGIVLLASTILAGRTFSRIFEAPADKVYAAAFRAAQTDGRVTILTENASQRRLHLRVNVVTAGMMDSPIGQPPSGRPPMDAGSSTSEQWGGILLTLIVTPSGPLQSSVTVESQSVGPDIQVGQYPGRLPGDRRNAQEFQERQAACTMLVRMRSILKLPTRKIGGLVSADGCE